MTTVLTMLLSPSTSLCHAKHTSTSTSVCHEKLMSSPRPGATHSRLCPAFHAAVWRQGEAAGGTGAGAGERADAGARARRAVRAGVSHLARLAAVGLGLALGALQQRRRQRLAARGVAAQPDQVGGLQRQHAAVAVDFDAAPAGARVLGLHHLAADAVELGRASASQRLRHTASRRGPEAFAAPAPAPRGCRP